MSIEFLALNWQLPANIKALVTTRIGGYSNASYASLNLATHVGDNAAHVQQNRQLLAQYLPQEPIWLQQNHTTNVLDLMRAPQNMNNAQHYEYDAAITDTKQQVLTVMTADCVPILITDKTGSFVAAVHAGWKGIAANIVAAIFVTLPANVAPKDLLIYLAPSICQRHFEIDYEVYQQLLQLGKEYHQFFYLQVKNGKFYGDLPGILTQQFIAMGALPANVTNCGLCTYCDSARFYSYRRDNSTGRIASCIWRE